MFKYSKKQLIELANKENFIANTVEKVLRLIEILKFINAHEIGSYLALKGGTAINLCLLNMKRLSVDADFDFVLPISKEEMLEKRLYIRNVIEKYMLSEGYTLNKKSKFVHTLDSFAFDYNTLSNSTDKLKIEINYSDRCHLLDIEKDTTTSILSESFTLMKLNKIELIGSKISALISRTVARDVYDTYNLIINNKISSHNLLKKIVIFYLCVGGEPFVEIEEPLNNCYLKMNKINYNLLRQNLIPVIHKNEKIDIELMINTVKEFLSNLFILDENEKLFIKEFNNKSYRPELLFDDIDIVNNIKYHPMALWRCKGE